MKTFLLLRVQLQNGETPAMKVIDPDISQSAGVWALAKCFSTKASVFKLGKSCREKNLATC